MDQFGQIVRAFVDGYKAREEQQRTACTHALDAARRTHEFLNLPTTGDSRAKQIPPLSKLWGDAAESLREFNHDLADLCDSTADGISQGSIEDEELKNRADQITRQIKPLQRQSSHRDTVLQLIGAVTLAAALLVCTAMILERLSKVQESLGQAGGNSNIHDKLDGIQTKAIEATAEKILASLGERDDGESIHRKLQNLPQSTQVDALKEQVKTIRGILDGINSTVARSSNIEGLESKLSDATAKLDGGLDVAKTMLERISDGLVTRKATVQYLLAQTNEAWEIVGSGKKSNESMEAFESAADALATEIDAAQIDFLTPGQIAKLESEVTKLKSAASKIRDDPFHPSELVKNRTEIWKHAGEIETSVSNLKSLFTTIRSTGSMPDK